MKKNIKPFLIQLVPISIVVILLAISLTLLRKATNNPYNTEHLNLWMVPLNALILFILTSLIIYNVAQLVSRLKSKQSGSRYTARLMAAFAVLMGGKQLVRKGNGRRWEPVFNALSCQTKN